jgi:hypothetical protein
MKSKGHLYIYIPKIFDKDQIIFLYTNKCSLQYIGEALHVPRTIIVFRLDKAGEVIRQHKFISGIVCATGQHFTFCLINREVLAQKFPVKIGQVTLE